MLTEKKETHFVPNMQATNEERIVKAVEYMAAAIDRMAAQLERAELQSRKRSLF